ncbi:MAG: NAD-dependent deacylase [Rhodocyclaceae bacterium]|nr:NAD-dependent deacylase [Rhodocyclaceae bacterium]
MPETTHQQMPPQLDSLLRSRRFERIVVFSGAGMSEDSGIPTFRSGSNGLWSEFDPQELATPQAWKQDRALVWGWYEWRRGLVMAARPHPGHLAVAQLQQRHGARVVTQNVDNLHERAGVTDVLHLHGSLFATRCAACGMPAELPDPPPSTPEQRIQPPRCPRCRGYVRPGVVWFGESLDQVVVDAACRHIAACDLLLIVGTSGVVYPAAGLVGLAPKDALIVEINPQLGEVAAKVGFRWPATAAVALPVLVEMLGSA